MITVYSTPVCMQCTATKKEFDRKGVAYDSVDLTQDAEAMAKVRALGYQQAPVVIVSEDEHWSGFRPDKISAVAEQYKTAA